MNGRNHLISAQQFLIIITALDLEGFLENDGEAALDYDFILGPLERLPEDYLMAQQPQINAHVTTEDLDRSVIPFFKLELEDQQFKENLDKEDPNTQLAVVQYLIQKYSHFNEFKADECLEKKVDDLDDHKIFTIPLEEAIKKIAGKPQGSVALDHVAFVSESLLSNLRELRTEIISKNNLNWIADLLYDLDALTTAQKQETFLINLALYLEQNSELDRARLLDIFKEIKKPRGGVFSFIHQSKHPKWDRFRLSFKTNCNGPEEAYFWHTSTYQKAVKMLKETYLEMPSINNHERKREERDFINYFRGNMPLHEDFTDTRLRFVP